MKNRWFIAVFFAVIACFLVFLRQHFHGMPYRDFILPLSIQTSQIGVGNN